MLTNFIAILANLLAGRELMEEKRDEIRCVDYNQFFSVLEKDLFSDLLVASAYIQPTIYTRTTNKSVGVSKVDFIGLQSRVTARWCRVSINMDTALRLHRHLHYIL